MIKFWKIIGFVIFVSVELKKLHFGRIINKCNS